MKTGKINVLDINKFIKENELVQITSDRTVDREKGPDSGGLFSEVIFGTLGSKERVSRFAYIDLKEKFLHPFFFTKMSKINTDVNKCVLKLEKYKLQDGILVKDENGKNGIKFLYEIWKKIDFDKYRKETNEKYIDYIKKTDINIIFIDKFIVVPAGMRDYSLDHFGRIEYDDINNIYIFIFRLTNGMDDDDNSLFSELVRSKENDREKLIQNKLNELYDYFLSRIGGKTGILRGSLFAKRLDYTGRLVSNLDINLPTTSIGMPWFFMALLFEPFVINRINNNQEWYNVFKNVIGENVDNKTMHQYLDYVQRNCSLVSKSNPEVKKALINILCDIIAKEDVMVYVKRDPVETPKRIVCGYPAIFEEDYQASRLNPICAKGMGLDSDGDAISFFVLMSREAMYDAKKNYHPYSIIFYRNIANSDIDPCLDEDALAGLRILTK